jgi:hypothetical protein
MALAHSVLRSRKRYGRDPLGRAVGAISHSTTTSLLATSSINLVWTLHGLEALYSTSDVISKEKLLGKTETILRPRTENKKAFGSI